MYMSNKEQNHLVGMLACRPAPAGASALSPRQAAAAAPPWDTVTLPTTVAPAGAKARSNNATRFRPYRGDGDFGGVVYPRPRGYRRLPWAKSSSPYRGQTIAHPQPKAEKL